MKRTFLFLLTMLVFQSYIEAQNIDFSKEPSLGSLYIRMYGNINANQKFQSGKRFNGQWDAQRVVTLFGYQFSNQTQLVTEIEVEHGEEIFVEQAFIKHQFNQAFGLKAGVILIPMGYINENHEPTLYYSVERPMLDALIVPTTWREVAIGLTGLINSASLKYQAYFVNGFKSYDNGGIIKGSNGLRSGRQKALESTYSGNPNFSFKIEHFGISDLKVALSYYNGKTQSTLFNGIEDANSLLLAQADSTVVHVNMLGFYALYNKKGLDLRTQFIFSKLGNAEQYNAFTGKDLGDTMMGYYVEAAYDLWAGRENSDQSLIPFARFSQVNTHFKVTDGMEKNANYNYKILTFGINWKPANGAVFKLDYQIVNTAGSEDYNQLNAGIGFWF